MADAINITNHSDWIPALVAAEGLAQLQNNVVLAPLINNMFSADVAEYGDSVTVPQTGTLALVAMTADQTLTPVSPTQGTPRTITLSRHVAVPFYIKNMAAALAKPSLLRPYMKDGIMLIAQAIEATIAAAYTNFATAATSVAGVDLDSEILPDLKQALRDAKCPAGLFDMPGGISLVMSTKDEASCLRDPDLRDAFKTGETGPGSIVTGRQARRFGFDFYISQNIVNAGGAYHNMCFAKDALALVSRPLPAPDSNLGVRSEYISMPLGREEDGAGSFSGIVFRVDESWDALKQSHLLVISCLYGVGALRPSLGLDVLS